MSTAYHAKYYAHELTKRSATNGIEKISRSLFDASVDLNPHQIEAALFVFRSPLSKGVILADEVGLGKTIEAGLVLCQLWAERKRKLLIICPASLRKQWSMEIEEKFNLPSYILEAKTYRDAVKEGLTDPFQRNAIIIASFHYANRMKNEVRSISWDIVVIDEAHKLRNVYRTSNKMGQGIKWALEDRKKVLLTATPLQNSLLELYGLSLMIDEHIFGDAIAFRAQYMNSKADLHALKVRLKSFTHRTLRSQVLEYIQYTERIAVTVPFIPSDDEQALYEAISQFLMREDTYAIPKSQRILTTLIIRKLLSSSSHAVSGTLETMKKRLELIKDGLQTEADNLWVEALVDEDEMASDWIDEGLDEASEEFQSSIIEKNVTIDKKKLDQEIKQLEQYMRWSSSIQIDSKAKALLISLQLGFEKMEAMEAKRKALIFTESRRTQEYLKQFLENNGYKGEIVLFNGTNTDKESNAIYETWVARNEGTGRASGSRTADKRAALVEYFRDTAEIMIATEAAAEGVNLQFCSLLVNYDLPWNPQRIEQRIGRCHRYGQKHDVVVINFINERNDADRRVYELLQEKFHLFSGVLGASDEVLGSLESGVDFEKRILSIYQQCRTPEEIGAAFSALQEELEQSITSRIKDTQRSLLENFDEDVHARLKMNLDNARTQLDRFTKMFWILTKYILSKVAEFNEDDFSFQLHRSVHGVGNQPSSYQLISKNKELSENALYRLSHPLGEYVVNEGMRCPTSIALVEFDITNHPLKISVIERLRDRSGCMILTRLTIDSFETEDYLLFNGFTEDGTILDQEQCEKLFQCSGLVSSEQSLSVITEKKLVGEAQRHVAATISKSLLQNNQYFQDERDRLEKWADDLVISSERELNDTKAKIREAKRQERLATSLEEQHQLQLKIKELERNQRRQRQRIFDVEDEIMQKRDELIDELEQRMKQRTEHETLFIIQWRII
jgi:ERCC4-related helicase